MSAFTDPRSDPEPGSGIIQARTATDAQALKELYELCQDGRLYDVEQGGRLMIRLQETSRCSGNHPNVFRGNRCDHPPGDSTSAS